ncbi:MAG: serine hydrolase domain-containing protein [Balneolales bacterium]
MNLTYHRKDLRSQFNSRPLKSTSLFYGLMAAFFIGALPVQQTFSQTFQQVQPEEAGFSADRLMRLTTTLNDYADQERLSGGVTLVLKNEKAVYFDAFGKRDVEAGFPMQKDDIFRIASQTKAIVSVAIMMLQEKGELLLSDPVGKYLPEFKETTVAKENGDGDYDIVDAERPINIRDLLTHTSGIGYGHGIASDKWEEAGIQGWYFADRDEPIRETVSRIADLPFDSQPGQSWVYGYSTDILGVIVEEISGKTLEEFLGLQIFGPLGMNDTHFYLPQSKLDRLAVVYSATDQSSIERAPDLTGAIGQGHYVQGPRKSFSAGAGLLSTANDYARFLQMLLNGGELDGERILSPGSVELMSVNHIRDIPFRDGSGMGLGFSVVEDLGARGVPGSVGEYGWGGAYHSTYWVDPAKDLVVVFFTQLIPATGSDIHGKLRTLIYQAIENTE